jgi:dolichyl-phosphate-mannose-protein mannosyltransferase
MEHALSRLRHTLLRIGAMLTRTALAIDALLERRAKTDKQLVIIIFALALLVRVPFIAHPDRTMFDEVLYGNFTTFMVDQKPYFDIHPPFARTIFASIADNYSIRHVESPPTTGQPFVDFPYASIRLLNAVLGSLLPLVIYLIARLFSFSPRMAALAGLFVVFDNAFVLYSRAVLPDTLMFTLNMIGFAATISALRSGGSSAGWYAALAGLLLGAAVSIKWTALGVFLAASFALLLYRRWRELLIVSMLVPLVYISIFVAYFSWFPNGGQPTPFLYRSEQEYIFTLDFPRDGIAGRLAFLPRLHAAMLEANRDPNIINVTMGAAGPISWPAAQSAVAFWANEDQTKRVILQGNSLLWFTMFFGICFEIGWILYHGALSLWWRLRFRGQAEKAGGALDERAFAALGIDRMEAILLAGYALNFLPFFLIHRPMYLYHYMTALLFLFLLTPRVAPRIIDCFATITADRLLARTLAVAILALSFVNFFLVAQDTYGF